MPTNPSAGDLENGSDFDGHLGGGGRRRHDGSECTACGLAILDKYVLQVEDQRWHSHCLRCSHCHVPLDAEKSCFTKDGNIYCKEDYFRLFVCKRCSRCGRVIDINDLVMKVDDHVYHVSCFTCALCQVKLVQGDFFRIIDNLVYCAAHSDPLRGPPVVSPGFEGRLYCRPDFLAGNLATYGPLYGSPVNGVGGGGGGHCGAQLGPLLAGNGMAPTQPGPARKGRPRKRKSPLTAEGLVVTSGTGSSCSLMDGGPMGMGQGGGLGQNISGSVDSLPSGGSLHEASTPNGQASGSCHGGNGRTKRMRTSFKHHQLRTMKQYFQLNQNPDAKDLKQLAQKTQLSKRVLQVWFQNARAKWRRNNHKLQDPNGCLSGHLSGDGSVTSNQGLGGSHSLVNPGTPSTGIGSPGDSSTRQYSSPSPSLTGVHVSQDSAGLPSNPGSEPGSISNMDQSRNFEVLSQWTELSSARGDSCSLSFPPI
ncbi:LIM/homeobox protein Lhx9 [Halotydeus destructor]|nr:LIM/homeobox protein Lhx9 [Halotydeus destructor]